MRERYLRKNEKGEIIETPQGMFHRVAKAIAAVEKKYDKKADTQVLEEEFYKMMTNLEFLPNSPTLMNAGTPISQLSACFVLPVFDSLKSIMKVVTDMSLIHQSGGGTGFSFSKLRPRGDIVRSTGGTASGPISFAQIFDKTTEVVKQGGRRRGANMGILDVSHPDILDFIAAKKEKGRLKNFNLSVAVTDKFMRAVQKNQEYDLVNPRTKKPVKKLQARQVFDLMALSAWETGDPGLIFLDEINRKNPLPSLGKIEATNPCGEQPLLPYESCNLGSINLAKFVTDGKLDLGRLKKIIHLALHFLDNVIDANRFPLKEIEQQTKANRKVGLGVMGFAQMLILLGIPYNSQKAQDSAAMIMKFINTEARKESVSLGKKRGSFPNFAKSVWAKKYPTMRNATCTTIAPTGSISILAGTSSGIEPLFALVFVRKVLEGARLLEIDPFFEKILKEKNLYDQKLLSEIAKSGSICKIQKIPKNLRQLFVTSLDLDSSEHIKMQATFQKFTDNAVSKTINLPYDASIEEVRKAFISAWKLKCKGLTLYRYGSKEEQVLNLGKRIYKEAQEEFISAESEYAGGCEARVCPY
ncbi:MAG: adenosylcobalamin-dependent ribonucleoside-diphosphate reductase [Patescibacteria group bacterium]